MESILKHIITESDLELHMDLFDDNVIVGQEVELTDEQYAALNLEAHEVTEWDISVDGPYYNMGYVVGDKIERAVVPAGLDNIDEE